MKVIKHETEVLETGVTLEKYFLDIGYVFHDGRDENGDQFSALWTKKNKPVPNQSVTYKRAEKAVDKFCNPTRSKL